MKPGSPLTDVISRIDQTARQARDYVAKAAHLHLTTSNDLQTLVLDDGSGARPFGLEDLVHDQLASLTGVPSAYYNRMRTEAPQLLGANVNAWLQKSVHRHLIRTLHDPASPVVRAIVSDRYRPLDHAQLLEAILPILRAENVKIVSSEVTPQRLYVKALNERVTGEVKVGETVMAGIAISNSEVGLGALTIQPLIYTLRCTNGMIVEDTSLRRHHVGKRHDASDAIEQLLSNEARVADDRAFFLRVRDITRGALDQAVFMQQLGRLQEAALWPLGTKDDRIVEVTAKRYHLSTSEGVGILAHLRAGGDLSQWGLCSAITRHAQDVLSFDRSTELERIGGQVVASSVDWNTLTLPN